MLLVHDEQQRLTAVNAMHKDPRIGWVKFYPNSVELGLTSMYLEGLIKEMLTAAGV